MNIYTKDICIRKELCLTFLLVFTFSFLTFGQSKDFDSGVFTGKLKKEIFFEKHYLSYLSFDVNFSQPNFYNNDFLDSIYEESITNTNDFGWGISLKLELFNAFILDANFSQIRYTSELAENDILFDDFGVDLSYSLLRNDFFKPYIGSGYKFSKLSTNFGGTDTFQAIWKVGFIITPIRSGDVWNIYLIGEYKQPFNISRIHAYNQITFGIGISIDNY